MEKEQSAAKTSNTLVADLVPVFAGKKQTFASKHAGPQRARGGTQGATHVRDTVVEVLHNGGHLLGELEDAGTLVRLTKSTRGRNHGDIPMLITRRTSLGPQRPHRGGHNLQATQGRLTGGPPSHSDGS